MASVVMLGGGMTPASDVVRSSAAWMRASAGGKDGIVRYSHMCVMGVDDVYFVAAVMFPRCSHVVSACRVWCPCLTDTRYQM